MVTLPRGNRSGPRPLSRYCQGDEKHVDRPPRYGARARREPTMLGINNGRQPQLDNTSERGIEGGSSPRTAASRPWIGYHARTQDGQKGNPG